jgi:choline dehydrogenase-like flavoprotein
MRDKRETNKTMTIEAKAFVVAAGSIASSELLLKSKLGNKNVGHSIGFHPSPAVLARYEQDVNSFRGIPMSYHVDEFAQVNGERGYMVEGCFLQPIQFSFGLPSFFPDMMRDYKRYAMSINLLHDEQSGVVRLNANGQGIFFYELAERDGVMLVEAMKRAAEIYFATDPAPEAVLTTQRKRTIIHDASDIDVIGRRGVKPTDVTLISAHPQGGNRMGEGGDLYAVDPDFRLYSTGDSTYPNIYVCDGSVFPSTVGINPQCTIMALAMEAAKHVDWGAGT